MLQIGKNQTAIASPQIAGDDNELLAYNQNNVLQTASYPRRSQTKGETPEKKSSYPYELWASILGAISFQKAEQQTPAFQPLTGGAIASFDQEISKQIRCGIGAAYTFTHIHEKQDAGHSNIHAESLYLYSLWNSERLYCDAALWASAFQASNLRKIHMTGFDFHAKSHPKGWQLTPHFEIGYDWNFASRRFITEPFIMLDWIGNWQNRIKESGNSPFNAVQHSRFSSFLRSEAGIRFYQRVDFIHWALAIQETGAYVNKKPFGVGLVAGSLAGVPGSFSLETFSTTQNLGLASLQLCFQPVDPSAPSGHLDYQGEFGSMYQSHLLSATVCWDF